MPSSHRLFEVCSSLITEHGHSDLVHGNFLRLGAVVADHACANLVFDGFGHVVSLQVSVQELSETRHLINES